MNKLLLHIIVFFLFPRLTFAQLVPYEMPCECQDERFHIWNIKKSNANVLIKWRGNYVVTNMLDLKQILRKDSVLHYLELYHVLYKGKSLADSIKLKNTTIFHFSQDSLNFYQKEWTSLGADIFLEKYFDFITNKYFWYSKTNLVPDHLQFFLNQKCFFIRKKDGKFGLSLYNLFWHRDLFYQILMKHFNYDLSKELIQNMGKVSELDELRNFIKDIIN